MRDPLPPPTSHLPPPAPAKQYAGERRQVKMYGAQSPISLTYSRHIFFALLKTKLAEIFLPETFQILAIAFKITRNGSLLNNQTSKFKSSRQDGLLNEISSPYALSVMWQATRWSWENVILNKDANCNKARDTPLPCEQAGSCTYILTDCDQYKKLIFFSFLWLPCDECMSMWSFICRTNDYSVGLNDQCSAHDSKLLLHGTPFTWKTFQNRS